MKEIFLLQVLVFGYGGMRIYPDYLQFKNTFLPPDTTKLTLTGLEYLGSKFDLELTDTLVTLTCHVRPSVALDIIFDGTPDISFPFTWDGKFINKIVPMQVIFDNLGWFNSFFSDLPQSFPKDGFLLQSQASTGCEPPLDEVNVSYG